MHMKPTAGTNVVTIAIGLGAAIFMIAADAHAGKQEIPTNFNDYAVFMATGTIPFATHPVVPGCGSFIFCVGDYFQTEIMGRTQDEIDAEIARAKAYWSSRFGVDVDDPANAGRLDFITFMLDPRGDYRMYTKAGKTVPADGWVVRDGGFGVLVIDPNGFEMGGEFAGLGLTIQSGGMLVYGNYNVAVTNKNGKLKETIVWSYRSDMPMITNDWGELVVNCQLSDNNFADGTNNGKAQGMSLALVPGPGGFKLDWRNVITFSGNGGL